MDADRSYEDVVREYEQARVDHQQGFRRHLIERGITITSPDHLRAEQANYDIAHPEECAALEALVVEYSAVRAEMERRMLAATELAAQAHDTNARWARMADDRLAKGA